MSYSVSNVNNLRFIYCESKPQSEWAVFEQALESHFDETIDSTFKKKYERYSYTLFNEMIKLLDWVNWGEFQNAFDQPGLIFDLLIMNNPSNFANFIQSVTSEIAYRFRHEILRQSNESCEKLGQMHASQIFNCLNKAAHYDKSISKELLTTQIINCLDPDPKKEIETRINEYINALFKFPFAPSFENFLINFKAKLDGPNIAVEQLIDLLSQSVFFWDKKTLAQQSQLGLRNPYLTSLKIYQLSLEVTHQSEGDSKKCVINDHPLLKWLPNSQTHTISDILLLLMRMHIQQRLNKPSLRIIEVIKDLNQHSIELVTLNMKILKENIQNHRSMLYEWNKRAEINQEEWLNRITIADQGS